MIVFRFMSSGVIKVFIERIALEINAKVNETFIIVGVNFCVLEVDSGDMSTLVFQNKLLNGGAVNVKSVQDCFV